MKQKLQKNLLKHALEILLLLSLVSIALVIAPSLIRGSLIIEAILFLLGFCPSIISMYVLFKFTGAYAAKGVEQGYWLRVKPAIVTGILYPLVFFIINVTKYSFSPPGNLYEELSFFLKLVLTSLSFSFFIGGLTAKLLKSKSEVYFAVSSLFGVSLACVETAAVLAVEPPPKPLLGFFGTSLIASMLGLMFFIALVKSTHIKHQ